MVSETSVALLFPGQGAHNASMLDAVRNHLSFNERYGFICETLKFDPLSRIATGEAELINANLVSSLLTVLASVIAHEEWLKSNPAPTALAGYSIGQWTALYASNALTFETLIRAVENRALLMDECSRKIPGSMMAVIGVAPAALSALCDSLRQEGCNIEISNFNCYGQYSLAGTSGSIERAMERIGELKPKKAVKLPTSGAWHCSLLNDAASKFERFLQDYPVNDLAIPVIDNVTGRFLPTAASELKQRLAIQINHPVQWETGMKTLISHGCNKFVEVGFGNTLTKFGFFIDRSSVQHLAFYPTAVLA